MQIYTGTCFGKDNHDLLKKYNLGLMHVTGFGWAPDKTHKKFPAAMDNGAFRCWQMGYPFNGELFEKRLQGNQKAGIKMDFIACPDIVTGGMDSLSFSMEWAQGRLRGAPRLALVVQDGMVPESHCITAYHRRPFNTIFVGGSVDFKWSTAAAWVAFAHKHSMRCHIGQVGKPEYISRARAMKADSIDSTSIIRNKSEAVLNEILNGVEDPLFDLLEG